MGRIRGALSKVKYIAWNGSKTKEEPVVAKYEYDKKGRLRAEWNPEIKPNPVKMIYGYDTEEHVTAVSTTGHEPSPFEQGTIQATSKPRPVAGRRSTVRWYGARRWRSACY